MLSKSDLININKALEILGKSGVVAVPTDTVYGLVADYEDLQAIDKISKIKGRAENKQYVLQIAYFHQLEMLTATISKETELIIRRYWPGQVTFIFNINPLLKLNYLQETIAVRMPSHELMLKLLQLYNRPLVVTSFNKAGEEPVCNAQDISEDLRGKLDYLLESTAQSSKVASTIVDLTKTVPQVIRQGIIIFE